MERFGAAGFLIGIGVGIGITILHFMSLIPIEQEFLRQINNQIGISSIRGASPGVLITLFIGCIGALVGIIIFKIKRLLKKN